MTWAALAVVSCATLAGGIGLFLWLSNPPDDGFGDLFGGEEEYDGDC